MICQEACRLLPSFKNKSMDARKKIVTRFTKTIGLSHYATIHTAQKNFQETEEES
jgi:hypothetical protein